MNARVNFIRYNRKVYRNFATVTPTQDLVDDLVDRKEDGELLADSYYENGALRELSPFERSLKRSYDAVVQSEIDAKFNPQNWRASRYSDGTWAVLYAAESEETALYEVAFHLREDFYKEELEKGGEVNVDRRVCSLLAKSSRCVDVLKISGARKKGLTSQDRSGYGHCQKLAKISREAGAEMLKAPSARHPDGTCIAFFDKTAVAIDHGHLKYVKLVLTRKECRVLAERDVIKFDDLSE